MRISLPIPRKLLLAIAATLLWAFITLMLEVPIILEAAYVLMIIGIIEGRGRIREITEGIRKEVMSREKLPVLMAIALFTGITFWILRYMIQVFLYSFGDVVYDAAVFWNIKPEIVLSFLYFAVFTAFSRELLFRDLVSNEVPPQWQIPLVALLMTLFGAGSIVRGTFPIETPNYMIGLFTLATIGVLSGIAYRYGGLKASMPMHLSVLFIPAIMDISVEWKENVIVWSEGIPVVFGYSPFKTAAISLAALLIAWMISSLLCRTVFRSLDGSISMKESVAARVFSSKKILRTSREKRKAILWAVILLFGGILPTYVAIDAPSLLPGETPVYTVNYTVSKHREIENQFINIKRPSIEPPESIFNDMETENMTGFEMTVGIIDSSTFRDDRVHVSVETFINGKSETTKRTWDLGIIVAGQGDLHYRLTFDEILALSGFSLQEIIPSNLTTVDREHAWEDRTFEVVEYVKVTFTVEQRDPGTLQPFDLNCALELTIDKWYMSSDVRAWETGHTHP